MTQLTDDFAATLLAAGASWTGRTDLYVQLVAEGYAFDPETPLPVDPGDLNAEAQLSGCTVVDGWAAADPVLFSSHEPGRPTVAILIAEGVSRVPLIFIDDAEVLPQLPTQPVYWLTWQGKGIFRP